MKFHAVVCSLLCAGADAVSAQSEVSARVWMRDHRQPNQDDLSELKTENPDAYALVNALLTKRSLGLLDPKHPTASFGKAPPTDDSETKLTGAAEYARFATTEKEKAALQGVTVDVSEPYPDASASAAAVPYPSAGGASHDWMSWKPQDSGASDDAMVKNVLGAVAGLTMKGKSLRGGAADDESANPFASEAASQMAAESAPQPVAAEVATTTQASSENPYLKTMDMAPAASTIKEQIASFPDQAGGNALSSFAWDDSQTTTTTAAPKASKSGVGGNPLGAWLGMVKPHVVTAAPQEAKPSNPYLTDLQ